MKDFEYRPAQDHGLSPAEQFRSLKREIGLTGHATQAAWRLLTRAYLRCYHRLQVTGAENLPSAAPFVVIANHSSHLDTLVLASALPWRLREHVFPIAAGDVFFETPATSAFSALMLNALPMWRKKCGSHALQVLRDKLIGDPAIYILFPEGTRTRDGSLGTFKAGLGMMVAGAPVPVIPCHLSGAWEAWPSGRAVPSARKLRLRIGKPHVFGHLPNTRESWQQIAEDLRTAVELLATPRSTVHDVG